MKKTTKKLSLKKTTVKLLVNNETRVLAGGTSFISFLCGPSKGCSNNSCEICHEN